MMEILYHNKQLLHKKSPLTAITGWHIKIRPVDEVGIRETDKGEKENAKLKKKTTVESRMLKQRYKEDECISH